MVKKNLLLETLRAGPIRSDQWEGVASSGTSLRVGIVHLRARGFHIEAVPDRRPDERRGGRAPVKYVLRMEPAPPA